MFPLEKWSSFGGKPLWWLCQDVFKLQVVISTVAHLTYLLQRGKSLGKGGQKRKGRSFEERRSGSVGRCAEKVRCAFPFPPLPRHFPSRASSPPASLPLPRPGRSTARRPWTWENVLISSRSDASALATVAAASFTTISVLSPAFEIHWSLRKYFREGVELIGLFPLYALYKSTLRMFSFIDPEFVAKNGGG